MIVQEEFLKKIKDFGLNSYEAKIWTALLSRGIATAGELSDISNVPRSRSYDVLESLEKKGFIVMKLGKPIKYIAVSPQEVIERVKKKVKDEAENSMNVMDELRESVILKELTQLHNNGIEGVNIEEITGALKGQANIYDHLNSMLKSAEEQVILVTSEEGLNRKSQSLIRHLRKAHKKGVNITIAAPLNENNKEAADVFRQFADVVHLEETKMRFMLVDNKQVAFMLTDDEKIHPSYDAGVWVNTSMFAQALSTMFASLIKK